MTNTSEVKLHHIYTIWGLILIVWALYRVYMQLPQWADELIFKPLVFILPVTFFVLNQEKRPLASIGLKGGKLRRDIILGVGIGLLFLFEGMVANLAKSGQLSMIPKAPISGVNLPLVLILGLAGAFSEELLVRGFLFTRLKEEYRSELKALVVSALMYLVLLVPVVFTVNKLSGVTLLIFVMTNVVMSVANTMIFAETKTITVPVLIHAFWNMAVVLYL